MTTQPTSQCAVCVHFVSPFARTDGNWDAPASCGAFPDGIPDEVYGNLIDHREPIEGDNGVQWAPVPGAVYPEYARP